jgi:hypothetical protein
MTKPLRFAAGFIAGALIVALAIPAVASAGSATISGSAYLDYWFMPAAPNVSPEARQKLASSSLSGLTPEVALKIDLDVHETLSFTVRACYGCHGIEIDRAVHDALLAMAASRQDGR